MKHNYTVTIALIALFVLAQIFGLFLLSIDADISVNEETGERDVQFGDTAIGDRPETTSIGVLVFLFIGVLIGTLLLLYLARTNRVNIWKAWFFLASWIAIALALNVFVELSIFAWLLALIITSARIYYPNIFTQNIAELLMYAGIAVFLIPMLDVAVMVVVLILISLYDMYAVWKSKHMVKMAKFTAESDLFPGLSLKYNRKTNKPTKSSNEIKMSKKTRKASTGILGGGDIVFPLLFTGTVMLSLINQGVEEFIALQQALIITITSALALGTLLFLGQKQKFYPAMPFLSIGCFIGWGIVLLL